MSRLTSKTILVLSPQGWGKMFLSKHHYAVALARRGNRVYFLNPPDSSSSGVSVTPSDLHENLFIISHRLFFPYKLKFRLLPVFHALMRFHIRRIERSIEGRIDIIWSFDLGNLYPLKFFTKGALRVFHPVDEPLSAAAIQAAKGAEIIFSVTREILEKYEAFQAPKHFVNHGVSEEFLNSEPVLDPNASSSVNVGLSGNWLRPDIDGDILQKIIIDNPRINFHFWGSYQLSDANIGGGLNEQTKTLIDVLKQRPNVTFYGAVSSRQLATAIRKMQAFLICYDVQRDQSRGTNYHKIMEYLSTGKVIVSNNVTTYRDMPVLVQMVKERDHNRSLPDLFKTVVSNLDYYNSAEWQRQRISYAQDNAYDKQLLRIENLIYGA